MVKVPKDFIQLRINFSPQRHTNHNFKLSIDDVYEIRYSNHKYTYLAKKFRVSLATVHSIKKRLTHKNVY